MSMSYNILLTLKQNEELVDTSETTQLILNFFNCRKIQVNSMALLFYRALKYFLLYEYSIVKNNNNIYEKIINYQPNTLKIYLFREAIYNKTDFIITQKLKLIRVMICSQRFITLLLLSLRAKI